MASELVIKTQLDDDLKAIFNSGKRIDAVRVQLIRAVGGHADDQQLDEDLKAVYGIGTPEYKELACDLQILRIVQTAKNEKPAPGPVIPTVLAELNPPQAASPAPAA